MRAEGPPYGLMERAFSPCVFVSKLPSPLGWAGINRAFGPAITSNCASQQSIQFAQPLMRAYLIKTLRHFAPG